MNVYIMVDLEGISGIFSTEQTSPDKQRFKEAREFMTADVNVVIRACKDGGADKVYVRDCHGGSYTLLWEKLTTMCDYCILGNTSTDRFTGVEDCDGVILLGYHARAGTYGALLEHTFSSKTIQNMYINGTPIGEVALDAGIAGDYGKPVIMVSGDDKVCAEADALLPGVVTCEVKKGITWSGGMLLPPERAYRALYDKTIEAVGKLKTLNPFVYEKPVKLRAELTERGILPSGYSKPYMRIIDGRTFEVEGSTVEEALYRMF